MILKIKKKRLDVLLVEKGLADSRQKAQAFILANSVLVNETPIQKPGTLIDPSLNVRLRNNPLPYVSRGGLKLEGALEAFDVDVSGHIILDIGASTGGFTDCCLKKGALKSYAVDVGTNQLDFCLRNDPRVISMEKTNARNLTPEMFNPKASIAVIDVSFISITKILEPVCKCLLKEALILAMVKPQFEVGKEKIEKGGVVKSDLFRLEAVEKIQHFASQLGLFCLGTADSRVHGPKGNREIFLCLKKTNEL